MSTEAKEERGYEYLLREQLRPDEVLDGIVSAGPALTAAVTSERLMIVGPAKPNGWEMKSLPWRLVTEVVSETAADAEAEEQIVCLRYAMPAKASRHKAPAWQSNQDASAEEKPNPELPGELYLVLPLDGGRMAALLSARISAARPT